MSEQEFIAILAVFISIGIFASGMSILRSIRKRALRLKAAKEARPRTPFDRAVALEADELRLELAEERAALHIESDIARLRREFRSRTP